MTCRTSTTRWHNRCAPVLLLAAGLAGCSGGTGNGGDAPRTEQRGVAAFHSIDLRTAANVVVEVGPASTLSITADPQVLEHLRTSVHNHTLLIEQQGGWLKPGRLGQVEVHLSLPALHAFALNGAGKVRISGARGPALSLVVQGAGDLEATGSVAALNARLNGAGNMDLSRLAAGDATISVNGAGRMSANASGSLVAEVNGVGSIRYGGSPRELETRINGIGSIAPAPAGGP